MVKTCELPGLLAVLTTTAPGGSDCGTPPWLTTTFWPRDICWPRLNVCPPINIYIYKMYYMQDQ